METIDDESLQNILNAAVLSSPLLLALDIDENQSPLEAAIMAMRNRGFRLISVEEYRASLARNGKILLWIPVASNTTNIIDDFSSSSCSTATGNSSIHVTCNTKSQDLLSEYLLSQVETEMWPRAENLFDFNHNNHH
jgi:D-arabinose 5-phosphate isomerase GutQ